MSPKIGLCMTPDCRSRDLAAKGHIANVQVHVSTLAIGFRTHEMLVRRSLVSDDT